MKKVTVVLVVSARVLLCSLGGDHSVLVISLHVFSGLRLLSKLLVATLNVERVVDGVLRR